MHTALPLSELRAALARGEITPRDLIENALATATWRKAQGARTFLHLDPDWIRAEAGELDRGSGLEQALGGIPVSVKDCFDVSGQPTTAGSTFYAGTRPTPAADSWLAARVRAAGGVRLGKTHLNEFAYGITGDNAHFGPCEIPMRPGCLTGGSSSGAAASVVEGSAVVGLGTDTGGSLRAPASFCGLVSLRPTRGVGSLEGCFPLAQSFDTPGFLLRHLADAPIVAEALLDVPITPVPESAPRVGIPAGSWLEGCEGDILENHSDFAARLREAGAVTEEWDADAWNEAVSLFVPIQTFEAWANHRHLLPAHRDEYEPAVRQRIEFGGTVTPEAYAQYQARRAGWCVRQDELWGRFDFLALPVSPVREIRIGEDQSGFRSRILPLTAPASVAGWPVLTVRGRGAGPEDQESHGRGIGLVARPGSDAALLAWGAWLAARGF